MVSLILQCYSQVSTSYMALPVRQPNHDRDRLNILCQTDCGMNLCQEVSPAVSLLRFKAPGAPTSKIPTAGERCVSSYDAETHAPGRAACPSMMVYMDLGGTKALRETSPAVLLVQLCAKYEDSLGMKGEMHYVVIGPRLRYPMLPPDANKLQ